MQTKYIDLIEQTFDFPQNEFKLVDHCLRFHELNLMELIEKHGTPLKFNYLPRISENINACIQWFNHSIKKTNYTEITSTPIAQKAVIFLYFRRGFKKSSSS